MGVMALVEVSDACGCATLYQGGEQLSWSACPQHAAEAVLSGQA